MDPSGGADGRARHREFVVGTGGEGLDTLLTTAAHLAAGQDRGWGVMTMSLASSACTWSCSTVLGVPYSDSGRATCHGPAH